MNAIITGRADRIRHVVWAGFAVLVLLRLLSSPLSSLPLLLFVPGLLKRDWRTHIWVCFVLLAYFMVNINRLFLPGRTALDAIELVDIIALFIAAMLYARWAKQTSLVNDNAQC